MRMRCIMNLCRETHLLSLLENLSWKTNPREKEEEESNLKICHEYDYHLNIKTVCNALAVANVTLLQYYSGISSRYYNITQSTCLESMIT